MASVSVCVHVSVCGMPPIEASYLTNICSYMHMKY